jgi:hypothetical protein
MPFNGKRSVLRAKVLHWYLSVALSQCEGLVLIQPAYPDDREKAVSKRAEPSAVEFLAGLTRTHLSIVFQ